MQEESRDRATGDVTVVGASLSGLYTAGALAKKGQRVAVLERAPKLDPAPRTLIATHEVRTFLPSSRSVVNEIDRFELFSDGRSAVIQLPHPDVIVERSTLIAELAEDASDAGADIRLGHRFMGLQSDNGRLEVMLKNGNKEPTRRPSDVVVGADGATSKVAAAALLARQPTVPLVQAIVELPEGAEPNVTKVWFRPQDTRYFFWLIPEGPGRAAVGIIGEAPHHARQALDAFLFEQDLKPLEYQAARIPVYGGWKPIHRKVGPGNVYLVGDAAGHVKVSTVGGLVTGFKGADAVARLIAGEDGHRALRSLRRELEGHRLVRRAIHHFGQPQYSRMLDLMNARSTRLLSSYTRDQSSKILWRMSLVEPRLFLLAARGLMLRAPRPQ